MSLSTGIASTPVQKVSLDDLTALGLDRLQAMASGQQSSIAPSYLVIAAIEALKKGKAGVQQPQPQGTVKDQLLASLQPKPMPTPPQAMGIGAMAQQQAAQPAPQQPQTPQQPPQMMSGGGAVKGYSGADGQSSVQSDGFTPEWYQVAPVVGYGGAKAVQLAQQIDSLGKPPGVKGSAIELAREILGNPKILDTPKYAGLGASLKSLGSLGALGATALTTASTPTDQYRKRFAMETDDPSFMGDLAARGLGAASDLGNAMTFGYAGKFFKDKQEQENTPKTPTPVPRNPPPMADLPIPDVSLLKADPTAARIAASASQRGIGPFDPKLGVASGEIKPEKFERMTDSPVNQALIDAAEKFGKPDEARMKELRAAEENAGLAAFGAGMIKPGGSFGGVFAGAARDYVNAKETKAEKRREYEDNRELMAVKLKIAVGDEKAKKFWAETEYNDKRSDKAFERASKVTETGNNAVHINNQATLELAKLKLMQEKNALEAAMLKEGKSQANQAKLEKVYLMAHEIAIKDAESIYGKTEDTSGVLNPTKAADKQRHIENKTTQMLGDLTKYFGLPGAGSASPSTSPLRANYAK